MDVHELKLWPKPYEEVSSGRKPFELRKDDRDYKVGDILNLRHWDPETEKYSGRSMSAGVTCIYRGPFVAEGFVCMGIKVWSWLNDHNRDETRGDD